MGKLDFRMIGCAALGAAAAFLSANIADAAPATQAEAQRIQQTLELYVGKPRAGGGAAVTVTPSGDDYTISLSLEELVRPFSGLGFTLQSQPVTLTVTPQQGTLWRVVQTDMPEVALAINNQSVRMRIEGLRFEGVYDSALMAFLSAKSTQSATSVDSVSSGMMNVRRDGPSTMELTGTPTASGAVSAVAKGRTQSHSQSFRLTEGGKDISFDFSTKTIDVGVTIDAMKMKQLAAIWAFFVANPVDEAIKSKLSELKQLIRDVLPLFDAIAQDGKIATIVLSTPVGNFGAQELGVGFNMTGFRKEGAFGLRLGVAGLSLPESLLPAWSAPLIPVDVAIDFKARGYDLEAGANAMLDIMRPDISGDTAEAAGRDAVQTIFPDSKTIVALGPSRIVSKLLTLTFEGELTVFRPIPKGRFTLRAKGIDDAIEHLQKTGAGDKAATQITMVLIGAKGFGKAEPDGSLVWVIENPDGGLPTINGASIPGMGK